MEDYSYIQMIQLLCIFETVLWCVCVCVCVRARARARGCVWGWGWGGGVGGCERVLVVRAGVLAPSPGVPPGMLRW